MLMKINDVDYKVCYNLRSMFLFEQIADKPFELKGLFDLYLFLYSCIVSVKDNKELDFDSFIDYCNDHPEVMEEFQHIMEKESKKRDLVGKKKVMEENL